MTTARMRRMDRIATLYSEGHTIASIAEMIGVPMGTVSGEVTRLRQQGDQRVQYRHPEAAGTGFGRGKSTTTSSPIVTSSLSIDEIRASVIEYERQLLEELGRLRRLRDALS